VTAPGPPPPILDLREIDAGSEADAANALAPLFEGALRFPRLLVARRPFGDWSALFDAARTIAHAMPEEEQIELIDAHPRLGAPRGSVSALSFVEQGYARDAATAAAEEERQRVDAELARMNEAYETRFGFRYCVFVAGRPRAALLTEMEVALAADREAEIARALDAVVDIAEARLATIHAS
jgi:2-oxo-4-hydroxy-4-carboxy-5-ureidoimidazoline decarboxylase